MDEEKPLKMDKNEVIKSRFCGPVSKSVKHLLNEFKSIYEDKLRRLKCVSPEESLKMKVQILQSYVNDLNDQNQVLVQIVEELEKEANEKVVSLEVKIRASDETIHDLEHQSRCLEEDNRRLRAELQELRTDTRTLTQVMGVTLHTPPQETITDHSAYSAQSPQKPGDLMKAQVEDLRNQLKAKNGIIQSLREEIKTLLFHSAQKKNETLEKTMLLLQKMQLQSAQLTSGGIIGGACTRLWAEHQGAEASDGEGRRLAEVQVEVSTSKEEREEPAQTLYLQLKKSKTERKRQQEQIQTLQQENSKLLNKLQEQKRAVSGVNSHRVNKLEVCGLTSRLEQLQLDQGKASTHSTNQDHREHKPCRLDNGEACQADRPVLQNPSVDLQWNSSQHQERLLQSPKQVCLKKEQMKRREEKAKAASLELQDQEERMWRVQLDSLQVTQEQMRRTLTTREHHTGQLDICTIQCLQKQLQTSEEKVNSLGLEVGLLESKLQEKTEQSQQLRDQILKQREALSRASATLKDTRRAAGNKIHKRENKLSVAQKQLQEAKKQLADCEKECFQKQRELEKLQEESAELTGRVKEHSQELHTLSCEKRKVELELAVITEKYRTAQQEVTERDQVILQLRMELGVSEEKHQGALKELLLQEAEVSRLNERVRRQQGQLQELTGTCRQGNTQLEQKERDRQQLQSQLLLTQQQLKCQAERTEWTERELSASQQSHVADAERWNHKNLLLQKQLQQVQEQNIQHSHILPELRHNLSQVQHALQLSQEKVAEYEELLKKREDEMKLHKQQLEEVQEELSESRTSVQKHLSTADIFKQKYITAMEKVQQLHSTSQRLEEDAQLSHKQVVEARAEVSSLQAEMSSVQCRYEKKVSQMEHWEETVEQLTQELQATLHSLRTGEERGLQCEEEMERLRAKVDGQQKQISDHEEKSLQLQSELTSYQDTHSHSNQEYEALQEQLDLFQKVLTQREEKEVQVNSDLQYTLLELHEEEQMLEEKREKEDEYQTVRIQLRLLDQQLQQLITLYTAHSVAGQEERAVLPSSLMTTEEQLSDSVESQSSSPLTQLQGVTQKLRTVASFSQMLLQKALEDTPRQSCEAEAERERDEAREQMQQQEALVCKLRKELEQELGRYEKQQLHLKKVKLQMAEMEIEVGSLKRKQTSDIDMMRRYDEKLSELSQQLQQSKRETRESSEERVHLEEEYSALQDTYDHTIQQLQQLNESLEKTLADNTHLQQEKHQLVTNISRWIKQHKAARQSLAGRIKEQNELLATISREKERLEQSRDSSEEELKMLRVQVEEREQEIQQLKAIHSHSANQQALVNQLRGRLEVENAHENLPANTFSRTEEM